jgi:hypothetical protein
MLLRDLDSRQKKVLSLFEKNKFIVTKNVTNLFNLSDRMAHNICQAWVKDKFFIVVDPSKKRRQYGLVKKWEKIFYGND